MNKFKNLKAKVNPRLAKLIFGLQVLTFGVTNAITANAVSLQYSNINDGGMMNNIIGILLTITRYVGVAITVYGVYETVLSFTSDQPEKRVKGISLALAGVVLIALKSILTGVISFAD